MSTTNSQWETAPERRGAVHLSHDLPCQRCGHAAHTYLACSDSCGCLPQPQPGTVRLVGAA